VEEPSEDAAEDRSRFGSQLRDPATKGSKSEKELPQDGKGSYSVKIQDSEFVVPVRAPDPIPYGETGEDGEEAEIDREAALQDLKEQCFVELYDRLYDDLSKDLYQDVMEDFTGKLVTRNHRTSAVGKLRDIYKKNQTGGIANLQRTLLQRRAEVNATTRNFIFGQRSDPRATAIRVPQRATYISSKDNLNFNNNNNNNNNNKNDDNNNRNGDEDNDEEGDDINSSDDDDRGADDHVINDNENDHDDINDYVDDWVSSSLLCCGLR